MLQPFLYHLRVVISYVGVGVQCNFNTVYAFSCCRKNVLCPCWKCCICVLFWKKY